MEILDEQVLNEKLNLNANFFDTDSYFIDEKIGFFKFANVYKVYDNTGEQIGSIRQKLTFGQKMLRLLINKALLPFKLEILDNNEEVQSVLKRGVTFFTSKIEIQDANGNTYAYIKQKFKLFKPTFVIYDLANQKIATITGDWKAWKFEITDAQEMVIGAINKKWAGALQEIFTSADKYNVTIDNSIKDKNAKMAILSAAITIDMVLKERK